MPEPITSLTAAELARRYRDGSLDPVTVTEAYLAAIEAHPEGGKVYRVVTAQRALKQARAAKRRFDEGLRVSPMQGVPIAIKDLVGTAGDVTAAGSRVLGERPAEVEDAPVAARLDAAGAVFLGKTNMTELAYSGIGANPHYGTPGCALDPSRIPGGSSSGSGVAVASQLAAVAVGSDTGGSVRIPAAVNGIVGLKVTDGRIPTDGCAALSTTLDTIGPLARTAEDAWALYLAMTAEPHRPLAQAPARLTLLAPTTLLTDDLDDATLTGFEQGLARLEALGHHVRREPLPILMEAPAAYSRFGSFASHEVWALYQDLFESRRHDFDPHVADRVYLYANRPSSDYIRLNYARGLPAALLALALRRGRRRRADHPARARADRGGPDGRRGLPPGEQPHPAQHGAVQRPRQPGGERARRHHRRRSLDRPDDRHAAAGGGAGARGGPSLGAPGGVTVR